MERQREKQVIQKEGVRTALETVTLTTLGSDPKFFMDMVDAASKEAIEQVNQNEYSLSEMRKVLI